MAGEQLALQEQSESVIHQKLLTQNFNVLKVQDSKKRKRQLGIANDQKHAKQLLLNNYQELQQEGARENIPQFRFAQNSLKDYDPH